MFFRNTLLSSVIFCLFVCLFLTNDTFFCLFILFEYDIAKSGKDTKGLLLNGLTFLMKIKHLHFCSKLFFRKKKKKRKKKIHSFISLNSKQKILKSTFSQKHLKLIMLDGHSYQLFNSIFIWEQCCWLYQTIFPSNSKVF